MAGDQLIQLLYCERKSTIKFPVFYTTKGVKIHNFDYQVDILPINL